MTLNQIGNQGSHLPQSGTVLESIDFVLAKLGGSVKDALLYHMSHTFNMVPEDFQSRPVEFHNSMKVILGEGGAYLEQRILVDLASRRVFSPEAQSFSQAISRELQSPDMVH